jgi:hypothetical protein
VVDGLFGLKRGDPRSNWEMEQRGGIVSNSRRGKKSRAAEAALLGLLGERDDKDTVR